MKIRTLGAELFRADGRMDRRTERRTDMTKLIAAFAILRTRPKTLYQHTPEYHPSNRYKHFDVRKFPSTKILKYVRFITLYT